MIKKFLILIWIIQSLYANKLTLQKYLSDFGQKSLLHWHDQNGSIKLDFKRKDIHVDGSPTLAILNNKVIDTFPKKDDIKKICPDFELSFFEISLIDKVVYNTKKHYIAILTTNQYTYTPGSGGVMPFYVYHLYVYHINPKNNEIRKVPKFDKIGWGDGMLEGGNRIKIEKIHCYYDGKVLPKFSYITENKIRGYLDSLPIVVEHQNNLNRQRYHQLEVIKEGIIDKKNNDILNKHITLIPTTYSFYIFKDKRGDEGIYKEVRLGSSQAQCFAPLYKKQKTYRIYNVYCYDREISDQHVYPIFYIYNMQGEKLKNFTFDSIDNYISSKGRIEQKNIVFNISNIIIPEKNTIINGNIKCIVPGKDFYHSTFENFKCYVHDLNKMLKELKEDSLEKTQYFDLSLIQNTIEQHPITPKTLTTYNNIAYYLQKAGANKEAVYLLEKIIEKFPNRTVAYYNLGDAYWELGEKKKAIKAYTTYIEQMCQKGLQKKIPKVVLGRVSKKK